MKRIVILFTLCLSLYGTKIGEITNVIGVRENQLIGYSLVVGLNGTGDGTQSAFTLQSISNMLRAMNVNIPASSLQVKNTAAVVVTATLKPFARQGDKFDITVSTIGDADSIEGGVLLMTPLKGVDGQIYALGQGSVSIGGRNAGAGNPSHPNSGLVYGGGVVEREIVHDIYNQTYANLSLKETSFNTAIKVQDTINNTYNTHVAVAIDPHTIKLQKPNNRSMVEFLASIQDMDISYTPKKKIIINERTGTVVAGLNIAIKPIVITHGDITIKVVEENTVNQPDGSIVVDPNLVIGLNENELYTKTGTTTVANITRSLQKLGATPKDIISILEAMKSAGAFAADLEVI